MKEDKKKNKYNIKFILYFALIVIIILSIILLLGSIVFVLFFKKEKSEQINKNVYGNKIYNMTSYSNNIIKYGDWIIYSNGDNLKNTRITNYEDGIYKYNMKTGQVVKLYNSNAYCLNLIENELYYCVTTEQIYKVNLDTLESEWIDEFNDVSYLSIYNNTIFYRSSNGGNIYSASLDGKNQKLVVEYTINEFQIYNGFIYYIDATTNNLFKKNIRNNDENPIKITNNKISNFYINNENLVYSSSNKLFVYDLYNNTSEELVDNVTSNFIYENNKLYFYSASNKSIIELDLISKQKNIISELTNDIYRLQYYDNYLFYYDSTGKYQYITIQLFYININDKTVEKIFFQTNDD